MATWSKLKADIDALKTAIEYKKSELVRYATKYGGSAQGDTTLRSSIDAFRRSLLSHEPLFVALWQKTHPVPDLKPDFAQHKLAAAVAANLAECFDSLHTLLLSSDLSLDAALEEQHHLIVAGEHFKAACEKVAKGESWPEKFLLQCHMPHISLAANQITPSVSIATASLQIARQSAAGQLVAQQPLLFLFDPIKGKTAHWLLLTRTCYMIADAQPKQKSEWSTWTQMQHWLPPDASSKWQTREYYRSNGSFNLPFGTLVNRPTNLAVEQVEYRLLQSIHANAIELLKLDRMASACLFQRNMPGARRVQGPADKSLFEWENEIVKTIDAIKRGVGRMMGYIADRWSELASGASEMWTFLTNELAMVQSYVQSPTWRSLLSLEQWTDLQISVAYTAAYTGRCLEKRMLQDPITQKGFSKTALSSIVEACTLHCILPRMTLARIANASPPQNKWAIVIPDSPDSPYPVQISLEKEQVRLQVKIDGCTLCNTAYYVKESNGQTITSQKQVLLGKQPLTVHWIPPQYAWKIGNNAFGNQKPPTSEKLYAVCRRISDMSQLVDSATTRQAAALVPRAAQLLNQAR